MSTAKLLLQKIMSNDRLFEPSNGFTTKAATKPRQTLINETSVNGSKCRFEAALISMPEDGFGIGFGELFTAEASPQSLKIRVL